MHSNNKQKHCMKRFTYLVKERSLSSGYDDSCIWTTGSRLSWISSLEKKRNIFKIFYVKKRIQCILQRLQNPMRKKTFTYFKDYEI